MKLRIVMACLMLAGCRAPVKPKPAAKTAPPAWINSAEAQLTNDTHFWYGSFTCISGKLFDTVAGEWLECQGGRFVPVPPQKKPPLPANACKTEPNGDKPWYPDQSEFSPAGFEDGHRMNFDGRPAVCVGGNWETDKIEAERMEKKIRPRDELLEAANTRLLTVDETKRLLGYGSGIFTREGIPFNHGDIDRKFNNLLFLQKRFMAEMDCPAPPILTAPPLPPHP